MATTPACHGHRQPVHGTTGDGSLTNP